MCKSNRDKKKLVHMILSMVGKTDKMIYGKNPILNTEDKKVYLSFPEDSNKYRELKLTKEKCCEIIELLSLYNRVIKGELHYKFNYEMEEYKLDDIYFI